MNSWRHWGTATDHGPFEHEKYHFNIKIAILTTLNM